MRPLHEKKEEQAVTGVSSSLGGITHENQLRPNDKIESRRARAAEPIPSIVEIHDDHWRTGDFVAEYAHRTLRPAEVIFLARYHRDLSRRVLEVGCGAGRVLGYLLSLCESVVGIDVSESMVAYCQNAYPKAEVHVGDLGALNDSVDGRFDAVVAADNVLGGFEDADRRRVLGEIRELLEPGGLLIFSSHNLADVNDARARGDQPASIVAKLVRTPPDRVARAVGRLPRRWRNRRRLGPLQYRRPDHALLNDAEGDFGVLHYYIGHADQRRQLRETGYELLECIDAAGTTVREGEHGRGPWLYYVARRSSD